MVAGMRDILGICTPQDTPRFQQLLGDVSQWGLNLQYTVQLGRFNGGSLGKRAEARGSPGAGHRRNHVYNQHPCGH